MTRAFISYHHTDRHVAGQIGALLQACEVTTFLAHEDIEVSEEWRLAILAEMRRTDLFVAVMSERYSASPWCLQEAGIAAFRGLTCIPLSLDQTVPAGFLGHVQSVRVDPATLSLGTLIPGLARHNHDWAMGLAINFVSNALSFRDAESRFRILLPYIDTLTEPQGSSLLQSCIANAQVHDASLCAREYLPRVLDIFGNTVSDDEFSFLADKVHEYREYADMPRWTPALRRVDRG